MFEVTHSWDRFRDRFEAQLGAHETVFMAPENAALMFLIARAMPDDAELFPRGKWAMIQELEGSLDRHIAALRHE